MDSNLVKASDPFRLFYCMLKLGCSLERIPGSLERTSFCLGGSLPETCLLERTLGKLERTSLWLRLLERTSGRLERRMFWMSPLERTYHRSSEPDAV